MTTFDRETAQQDTDIQNNYYPKDMDNFENAKQENYTNLKILT